MVLSWAKCSANSSRLRRSKVKSSSRRRVRRKCRTTAAGWYIRIWGACFSANSARPARISRSGMILLAIPACWTLTTTCSPECSRATCTWAMEAEAKGASSNCANRLLSGLPNSASMVARTVSGGSAGAVGLQMGQLPGHLRADDIGPRAQHLAELDESGAQFGECQAQALLDFEVRDMLAVNALNAVLDPRVMQVLDPIRQAVLCQHTDDFAYPVDVTFQSC